MNPLPQTLRARVGALLDMLAEQCETGSDHRHAILDASDRLYDDGDAQAAQSALREASAYARGCSDECEPSRMCFLCRAADATVEAAAILEAAAQADDESAFDDMLSDIQGDRSGSHIDPRDVDGAA